MNYSMIHVITAAQRLDYEQRHALRLVDLESVEQQYREGHVKKDELQDRLAAFAFARGPDRG